MRTGAAKAEAPAKPKPIRQQEAIRRETREIPASQHGRVRALTRYGMTRAQVARLYEVGVDEIERIIRGSTTSRRASA
jgi:DNA invertase Pin-like site-specific DNA recombinase